MTPDDNDAAIRNVIERQFRALSWSQIQTLDRTQFLSAFLPEAMLFPGRRPIKAMTPHAFVTRMESLRTDGLLEFKEVSKGIIIRRAGSVAIALAGCEMLENDEAITRDVSAFLLTKDNDGWHIAAQAWDTVRDFSALDRSLA